MKIAKRRHPDRARAELLDGATILFARLGFERTSLAAVGERAGVSRGLPAYFFSDKDNLYRAVIQRATERVRQLVLATVQSQPGDASAEEVLASIVNAYIDFLAANPDAVRLLQWESLNAIRMRQPGPAVLFDEAVVLIKKALRRSGYSAVDGRLLLLSLVGMCFFPFGFAKQARRNRAFLAAYKKHVLRLVLNGIRGTR